MKLFVREDGKRLFLVYLGKCPRMKKDMIVIEREDCVILAGYRDSTFWSEQSKYLVEIGEL